MSTKDTKKLNIRREANHYLYQLNAVVYYYFIVTDAQYYTIQAVRIKNGFVDKACNTQLSTTLWTLQTGFEILDYRLQF